MTPKEKALELVNKYKPFATCIDSIRDDSKECALIAVDEILNTNPFSFYDRKFHLYRTFEYQNYWQEVKKEIEAL